MASQEQARYGAEHYRQRSEETSTLMNRLISSGRKSVRDTLQGYSAGGPGAIEDALLGEELPECRDVARRRVQGLAKRLPALGRQNEFTLSVTSSDFVRFSALNVHLSVLNLRVSGPNPIPCASLPE
jgi:hypothetical protein